LIGGTNDRLQPRSALQLHSCYKRWRFLSNVTQEVSDGLLAT